MKTTTTVSGRVVALTGAASGIGRALALLLARNGAALALADRDAGGLAETVALLPPGTSATQHVADVADEAAVATFARDALAAHGNVDILINNAGVSIYGHVAELTVAEMRWLMDVNFWGVVHGVKAFLPALAGRPDACIVNVSSLFGLYAPPGQAIYSASKFAVRGFSDSLRGELAEEAGVHVLTVLPGGIKTAIARRTRVAAAADPAVAAERSRLFEERFLTISPDVAATRIFDGIRHKRDRVLIGAEAVRIDLLLRLLGPLAVRLMNARVKAAVEPASATVPVAAARREAVTNR